MQHPCQKAREGIVSIHHNLKSVGQCLISMRIQTTNGSVNGIETNPPTTLL